MKLYNQKGDVRYSNIASVVRIGPALFGILCAILYHGKLLRVVRIIYSTVFKLKSFIDW